MGPLKIVVSFVFLLALNYEKINGAIVGMHSLENNTTLNLDNLETIKPSIQESDGVQNNMLIDNVSIVKHYILGHRIPGDRLVAHGQKSMFWPVPSNVRVTINYPTQGIGAIISYVIITVNQDNALGQAQVLSGGINQRHISVVLDGTAVTHMSFTVDIYGQ